MNTLTTIRRPDGSLVDAYDILSFLRRHLSPEEGPTGDSSDPFRFSPEEILLQKEGAVVFQNQSQMSFEDRLLEQYDIWKNEVEWRSKLDMSRPENPSYLQKAKNRLAFYEFMLDRITSPGNER